MALFLRLLRCELLSSYLSYLSLCLSGSLLTSIVSRSAPSRIKLGRTGLVQTRLYTRDQQSEPSPSLLSHLRLADSPHSRTATAASFPGFVLPLTSSSLFPSLLLHSLACADSLIDHDSSSVRGCQLAPARGRIILVPLPRLVAERRRLSKSAPSCLPWLLALRPPPSRTA